MHQLRLFHRLFLEFLAWSRTSVTLEGRQAGPAYVCSGRLQDDACTMRMSASPSTPDGSGSRSCKMQSEKYSSSAPNWSCLANFLCLGLGFAVADRQLIGQWHTVIVGRREPQPSARSDQSVFGRFHGAKTAGEDGQPLFGEPKDGRGHLRALAESESRRRSPRPLITSIGSSRKR